MLHRLHKWIQFTLFILILLLSMNTTYNPFTSLPDIENVFSTTKVNQDDVLFQKIKRASEKYHEEPQNAYIDKVWKKTPGLSGIQVNEEKSFQNMKEQNKYDESLLVFDYIPPDITLADLPASPIYRGHPEKRMVSFLINVSWGESYIPDLLHTLKEHHVKATFFIEGKWAKDHPNLVQMIDEQGHLIGNHAYNHPDMANMSRDEIYKQIHETNTILQAIIDKTPQWFAPPSGSFSNQVVEVSEQLNMYTILWTVDTIDWKKPSPSVMINHVINHVHPGATILMHPTEPTAHGLSDMITMIKQKGYQIDTVEQLVDVDRK